VFSKRRVHDFAEISAKWPEVAELFQSDGSMLATLNPKFRKGNGEKSGYATDSGHSRATPGGVEKRAIRVAHETGMEVSKIVRTRWAGGRHFRQPDIAPPSHEARAAR
jgi:hypothetical protein